MRTKVNIKKMNIYFKKDILKKCPLTEDDNRGRRGKQGQLIVGKLIDN